MWPGGRGEVPTFWRGSARRTGDAGHSSPFGANVTRGWQELLPRHAPKAVEKNEFWKGIGEFPTQVGIIIGDLIF